VQGVGEIPFENLIVDFTEMLRGQRMYIFVGVCLHLLRMSGSLYHSD
jgi:hypothetical protein